MQGCVNLVTKKLNAKYGQKVPLAIHGGKIQEYLSMMSDYSEEGNVKFFMPD
jgi:hypothetical protein